jgi:sugar-specific transcriptional regulator TrmB
MDNALIEELEEFLKNLKVSSYGIASYMSLLPSNTFTAREICKRSGVPGGRIYEVLEDLKEKGLIRIQESRPKKYVAIPPNIAFHSLISHLKEENQKNINLLINRAKNLETDLFKSNLLKKNDTSRVFWSTALGYYSIESLYINSIRELEEELLINVLIDKNTSKRITFLKRVFDEIFKALNRGIQIKFLCSFKNEEEQFSERTKINQIKLYNDLTEKFKNVYNLSSSTDGLEIRATFTNIPTYYDLFDKKRVILRLQNPLNPSDIFACLNVLDPKLALELRKKFLNIWLFNATE